MGRPKLDLQTHFQKHVNRTNSCWLWTGCISRSTGYGIVGVDYEAIGAHRIAWEMNFGPIPEGMCVCHKCDVRHCVRPDHLFLDTQIGNVRDMVVKNRQAKGVKARSAKLTETRAQLARYLKREWRWTGVEIANVLGVTKGAIYELLKNRTWKHVH